LEFEDILAVICLVVMVVGPVLPIYLRARARRAQPLRHPMGWVSYTELLANGLSAPIGPLLRPPVYGPFSSEASNKALALLKRWLSPEQCKELEKRGSFDVVGCHTGRRYRIHPGKLNNVRILQDNVEVAALCFAPTDAGFLPEADIMLAQKIALETNEKAAPHSAGEQKAPAVQRLIWLDNQNLWRVRHTRPESSQLDSRAGGRKIILAHLCASFGGRRLHRS
jgi:hypothetical protein